jgi:YEATS domain-containing protein 4
MASSSGGGGSLLSSSPPGGGGSPGHGGGAGLKRVKGAVLKRPIIYGSVAQWLGKKAEEEGAHTHRWTVYVRGIQNEDLSPFIKRVTFNLHSSFEKPKRVIERPPYQVTETGWGEFDIVIQIALAGPSDKTLEVYHPLKLFHPEDIPPNKKPVVSEHYDEVVFNDPTDHLHRRFLRNPLPDLCSVGPAPGITFESSLSEVKPLGQIISTHHKVKREIASLYQTLEELARESDQLTETLQHYLGEPQN